MAFACRLQLARGETVCTTECPAEKPNGVFRHLRAESPDALPTPHRLGVDVAILDMNHGWPNLGHDSLVHAIREIACDLADEFERTQIFVRALSFDVRGKGSIPDPASRRFSLYVGTGGPGHVDPHRNDGVSDGTQGVREDPSWEERLFKLFDAIRDDPSAVLLAVCHTFGVMCRWSGIARPSMRSGVKGGKSAGVLENILTEEALSHPWFRRFANALPDGRRLKIVDSRLFDLIPDAGDLPQGATPLAYETLGVGGKPGNALTMVEFARDAGGAMPRILAVNHHPEIVDYERQLRIMRQKLERGEVSQEWFDERAKIVTHTSTDAEVERQLHLTSEYTLLGPLRFHLYRLYRRRAEELGLKTRIHEDQAVGA